MIKKTKKDDSIHVQLHNPISYRKGVLGMAIGVVELIKKYQTLREIRRQKLKEMEKLRELVKEIKKLATQARLREMPLKVKDLQAYEP